MNWEKYLLIWDEQCLSIWYPLLIKLWFVFKLEMVCFSRKYDLTSSHTKVSLMYTFSQNLCANKELIILGCNFACMTFLLFVWNVSKPKTMHCYFFLLNLRSMKLWQNDWWIIWIYIFHISIDFFMICILYLIYISLIDTFIV